MSNKSPQLFISHKSGDLPKIRPILDVLDNAGISYWLSNEKILAGQSFDEHIPPAIRAAKVVLLFCSQAAFSS